MNYQEYRDAWVHNPKQHIVSSFPFHLDIELTNECDLSCEQCPNHGPHARYAPDTFDDMDFKLYRKIIDEGKEKGLCAVKLSFRGEPLLYKKLPEAIFYAKNSRIMKVMINSNGMSLDTRMIIDLMVAGLDIFILSDYGFDKQLENGKEIQRLKKLLHFDSPKLRVKTFDAPKWYGIADEITEHTFHDYNSGEECMETSDFECEQLWQRLVILADGRVKVCCSSVMFPDGIIGDLNENTIEELWKGKYMTYIRFCHKNGRANLIESCRHCPGLIEYMEYKKRMRKK